MGLFRSRIFRYSYRKPLLTYYRLILDNRFLVSDISHKVRKPLASPTFHMNQGQFSSVERIFIGPSVNGFRSGLMIFELCRQSMSNSEHAIVLFSKYVASRSEAN